MKVGDIMSHIVTIEAKYKNLSVIEETCKLMGLEFSKGIHKFTFGGKSEGYKINLKGYCEPIVITEEGSIIYDDMYDKMFNNNELTKFKNNYCLIETERLLKKQNLKYKVTRENDEIKIEVVA
jgi:hypothetical protein